MVRDTILHHPTGIDDIARQPLPPSLTRRAGLAASPDALDTTLAYQPVVSLTNGHIMAAEMIAGWPIRQPPIARNTQARRRQADSQMAAAISAAAQWPASVALWLDVPSIPDGDPGFPDQIARMLQECGLAPERLSLELPESLAAGIDIDRLMWLSAVRDLGVGVILDGFGSWVASLAALRRLPLTGMKLDHGLVCGVPEEREDVAIVRAAVDAARNLGLQVIAEGIETESQRAFLSAIGCEYGQGVLFSHPLQDDALRHHFTHAAVKATGA